MSTEQKVLVEASEHILTITFNRPEKLNALDPESYHLLAQALYRLQHDSDLRVGVIQAKGKHFTSGLELDKWAPDRKSTRLNSSHVRSSYAVFCLKKNTGAWR